MVDVKHDLYVVIERDEDGMYIGEVPQLRGCYSQGRTLDELMTNIQAVIKICLDDYDSEDVVPEFVGVQKVPF